jgi:Lrp/AsnC family transcriptional regulator, leucine-responsive regulatory protein
MTLALDSVDRTILDILQSDCALTNQELADRVGTSPATCLRRVKRLVDAGVIERRIAILAPDVARNGAVTGIPSGITVIVEVTLDRQATEPQVAFQERAVADPDVQQCYRVTPGPDFVLVAYVSDTNAYQALAARLLTSANNVRNVRAYFAIARAKFEPRIPVLEAPVA